MTTSTDTSHHIHTLNFIKKIKKRKKEKKTVAVSDERKVSLDTYKEIQHKLFTLLVCSVCVKLFLYFGHNMESLCHVMMKIVPFLV